MTTPQTPQQSPSVVYVQAPPPPKKRRWPYVLGGIVVLLFIIGIANGGGSKPASTSVTPGNVTQPSQSANAAPAEPAKPAGPVASFGSGTYVVGTDVVAGTYKTSGSDSSVPCYWSRLKDTSGDFGAIIANGAPDGPTTVTISKSDGAFQTSGCKTWQKVS